MKPNLLGHGSEALHNREIIRFVLSDSTTLCNNYLDVRNRSTRPSSSKFAFRSIRDFLKLTRVRLRAIIFSSSVMSSKIYPSTKEFLERFEPEASLCGRNYNVRRLWVLAGLVLLFSAGCLCAALMFGTDTFDGYVLSNVVLTNTSLSFRLWKGPLVKTLLKVRVFNYTNVEAYENGTDAKLRVHEVGPYVYEETIERINVRFHANGTLSYQEKMSHVYRSDLSEGRVPNEMLVVPNLSLLGAAAMARDSFYVTRVAMSTLMKGLNAGPFVTLPADEYVWGYDDAFFELAKTVIHVPVDKIGILTTRAGVSRDVYNVHTGTGDVAKTLQMDRLNGKSRTNAWPVDECNRIKGSSGTAFSPYDVRTKRPLAVYNKDLCRNFPLIYDADVAVLNGKIPTRRYIVPADLFATDTCFCEANEECAPQGLFNAETCAHGMPIFVSLPHMHGADAETRRAVDGLDENPTHVETYMHVHPTLGFATGGVTRLQMNVQVQKSLGMDQLDVFDDDVILPLAWFEMGIDEIDLPDVVKDNLYVASVTVPAVEFCLKYGSLLAIAITATAIGIVVYGSRKSSTKDTV